MSFVTKRNGSDAVRANGPRLIREEVELDAGAPSVVRDLVRGVAEHTPVNEDALLLASEITTNAIIHGTWDPGDVLGVAIDVHPERLRIAVTGPGLPKPTRTPGPDTLGGFGLGLVASISDTWAMEAFGDGMTRVWFELSW